jgi:hypothetical protein
MGCDPRKLTFKLVVDRFTVGLQVWLRLHHHSLSFDDGEYACVEGLFLIDGGTGAGFGIGVQVHGID